MAVAANNFDSHPKVDDICKDVQVGENVAVSTGLVKEPFWILLCDKAVHIVIESFIDGWQNSYVVGDVVIRGFYYKCM